MLGTGVPQGLLAETLLVEGYAALQFAGHSVRRRWGKRLARPCCGRRPVARPTPMAIWVLTPTPMPDIAWRPRPRLGLWSHMHR